MAKRALIVDAGNHTRNNCPVSVVLEAKDLVNPGRTGLSQAGTVTPCQVTTEGDKLALTWIVRKQGLAAKKKYDIKTQRALKPKGGVELLDEPGERVSVFIGGKLFTHYYYGAAYPRPFMHPLIGPYGKTVTRDHPLPGGPEGEKKDHPHHRSIWTAWGELNGTDNWSELEGHARQVHRKFEQFTQGPVFGRIVARNDWVSKEGNKVCEEVREITFYNHPSAIRMVDYSVTFIATEGDLHFGDTKEGGILSVRVATSMDVPVSGRIHNSFGGINEGETWGKRAHWCDYTGKVAGKQVGIAVLDHPKNFRHPTYWHVRNYGLMTANPYGVSYFTGDKAKNGSYTLPAGQQMVYRYRLLVHKGDAIEGQIAERYHDFINPPAVTAE
jgi:hypothetical protein